MANLNNEFPKIPLSLKRAIASLPAFQQKCVVSLILKLFNLHPKLKEIKKNGKILYRIKGCDLVELRYGKYQGNYFIKLFVLLPCRTKSLLQLVRMQVFTKDWSEFERILYSKRGTGISCKKVFDWDKYKKYFKDNDLKEYSALENLVDFANKFWSERINRQLKLDN